MFNNCENDGYPLIEQIGNAKGYWKSKVIEFESIPILCCEKCQNIYLKQNIAIIVQEITRAIYDLNEYDVTTVNISSSYKSIIENKREIYNLLVEKKIYPIIDNNKLIIIAKDIKSFENKGDLGLLAAARNHNGENFTEDVLKEIEEMKNYEDQ
ncbi:hypothetical protein ACIZ62_12930 [Acetobacterium carbinolicum]|uniref:hypothetical protein n=1 Tax=Acetobacterium carbinolicum TaxID=52690 RepID=UPI0039BF0C0A